MNPPLDLLRAALHHLENGGSEVNEIQPKSTVISELARWLTAYEAIAQPIAQIKHLISLEAEDVNDPILKVEMFTLFQEGDCGTWQCGADTDTFVYASRSIPEDAVKDLAIAVTRHDHEQNGIDFVDVGVYAVSAYDPSDVDPD